MKSLLILLALSALLCYLDVIDAFTFVKLNAPCVSPKVLLFAKKKKGKKKNTKQSGFEWASSFKLKPTDAKVTRELASAAASSFQSRTGQPLTPELKGCSDLPKALWNAPIACVVVAAAEEAGEEQDVSTDSKVIVVKYANIAALETVGLSSNDYEKLIIDMSSVKPTVFIDLPNEMKGDKKYEGRYNKCILRASDDDHDDVTILNSHRWVLENSALIDGKFVTKTIGVAYAWSTWQLGENLTCSPGGIQNVKVDTENIEKAIETQALAIRELKEVHGFGNKDSEVMDAVQELKRLKAL
mmetsp:Transcript_27702/g.26532  ORF Transcript_27702/g.26532 Transcript_27702/m.26532 type:complete len:299 (-) Transcript_27702:197-1093(-)